MVDSPKVLVVEDEALLLFSISDELKDAGFEVLEAVDAQQALVLLERNPDVKAIFTDINMPGSMDGLALSRYVRDRWPPIKIVVTSGKHRPSDRDLPAERLFVPKPYTTDGVIAALTAALR
ncbi:response regulator [Devosia sp. UYZn731]|uniref:response regulator n=1 Tax=Devosia sp. UYZn731 TaxID=3156345 RepID=UPI0033944452